MERASSDPLEYNEDVYLANALGATAAEASYSPPIVKTDGGRTVPTSVVIHVKVVVNDGVLRKKAVFAITGEDVLGAFNCKRSFGDLLTLRSTLRWKWPGVVLPLLPSKKHFVRVTQVNADWMEKHREEVQEFLVVTTAVNYLGSSEDLQTFLRAPGDYAKARAAQRLWSLADVATQYTNMFTNLANPSFDPLVRLREEEKYFQTISEKLTTAYNSAKRAARAYDGFRTSYSELRKELCWAETYLQSCATEGQHKSMFFESRQDDWTNPYIYPEKWLKTELRLIQSALEAIRSILNLDAMRIGKDAKLEQGKRDLEQMQHGKQPLMYYLTFRSKEANKQAVERVVDAVSHTQSRDDAQSMGVIIRIASVRLLHDELPRIKSDRESAYALPMQQFAASFRIEQKLVGDM